MKNKYILFITASLINLFTLMGQDLVLASNKTTGENETKLASGSVKIDYYVPSIGDQLKAISPELAGNHTFGVNIARQLYLLESTYTYKVPVSPGNPTLKTIIQKPVIYSAVYKIEKQLRKDVKSKKIDINTASLELGKVLETAICIFNQETKTLEDKIYNVKDNSELIEIFTNEIRLHFLN
jgi:hypothetical protein